MHHPSYRALAFVLLTALVTPLAGEEQHSETVSERILSAITRSSSLEPSLRTLCDEIGPRLPGSPGMKRAVEWSVDAFRKAGADSVRTEPFEIPASWQEGATRIEVTYPVRFSVRGAASAWTPPTRRGGLRAEVLDGGSGAEGFIRRLGRKAKDKILLVRSDAVRTFLDLGNEQRDTTIALREAAEVGAAAVLFMSTRPHGLLYRHVNIVDGRLDVMPTALIAREEAQRVIRLLESNETVRMHIRLPNKTGGPFKDRNVVADVLGRETPDELVIVGAHLDSWDLGTGCLDNGANVVLLLETARALASARPRPSRTVRFILFSGEELGLLGSRAYAQTHRDELDSVSAVVVHDMGTGNIKGYSLGGRRDIQTGLMQAMEPVAGRGANAHSFDAFFGSDHFDFLLQGVPTLIAIQDTTDFVPVYHSSADTFDKVSLYGLRRQTGTAAVTIYNLADSPEPLGKRLTRREIEELLDETDLDKQMKFLGLWEEWAQGLRGRRRPQ